MPFEPDAPSRRREARSTHTWRVLRLALELSFIAHGSPPAAASAWQFQKPLAPRWPSPKVATLTLTHGASSLELRSRRARVPRTALSHSHEPTEKSAPVGRTPLRETGPDADGWYEILDDHSRSRTRRGHRHSISGAMGIKERLRIKEGDNGSCVWQGERSGSLKRGDWNCTVYSAFG